MQSEVAGYSNEDTAGCLVPVRTRLGAAYRCNAAYNGKAGRGAAYNETAWRGYVGRHAAYNGTARRGIDNNDTARRREDTAG